MLVFRKDLRIFASRDVKFFLQNQDPISPCWPIYARTRPICFSEALLFVFRATIIHDLCVSRAFFHETAETDRMGEAARRPLCASCSKHYNHSGHAGLAAIIISFLLSFRPVFVEASGSYRLTHLFAAAHTPLRPYNNNIILMNQRSPTVFFFFFFR